MAGELASPSTQLVKSLFDKLMTCTISHAIFDIPFTALLLEQHEIQHQRSHGAHADDNAHDHA